VQGAKDRARFEREMFDDAKARGESGEDLRLWREWVEEAEAAVREAEAELEELRKRRKPGQG